MTYTVQTVTSFADVISQIVAFAAARGWTTGGSSITNPATGRTWSLSSGIVVDNVPYLEAQDGSDGTRKCRTFAPILGGTWRNAGIIQQPTKVHLFGNNSPYAAPDTEPYVATVIEFGYNLYRHFYIGTMVKAGGYTDGDVVSANAFDNGHQDPSSTSSTTAFASSHRKLFSAYHYQDFDTYLGVDVTGGVVVTHADNPVPWRAFKWRGSTLGWLDDMDGTEVFGGQGDGVLDGMIYRSDVDYGAAQIMVPYNLFCANGDDGNEVAIRPLGHVSGPRAVSVKNLQPGQQVTISSDNWRVFPEFSKQVDASVPGGVGGAFRLKESSQYLGVAYKE